MYTARPLWDHHCIPIFNLHDHLYVMSMLILAQYLSISWNWEQMLLKQLCQGHDLYPLPSKRHYHGRSGPAMWTKYDSGSSYKGRVTSHSWRQISVSLAILFQISTGWATVLRERAFFRMYTHGLVRLTKMQLSKIVLYPLSAKIFVIPNIHLSLNEQWVDVTVKNP